MVLPWQHIAIGSVVLTVNSILLLVKLIAFVLSLRCSCWTFPSAKRAVQRHLGLGVPCGKSGDEEQASEAERMALKVEAMTMRLVELRKVSRIESLAPFLSLAFVIWIALDLITVHDVSSGKEAVQGSTLIFKEFTGLYCFLVIVAPQCFTLRRHYVGCILMNLSILYCVHNGSEMGKSFTYYRSLNEILFMVRIGQAGIFGNFLLQLFLNIMATGFSFVMADVWASTDCSALFSADDLSSFSLRSELAVVFVCLAVCVTTDRAVASEARVTVESRTSRNVEATAQSLLSVLCDAVVRTGPDFRITTPSPQLAALLLKSPGPRCFEGKVFTDLVHPEDRESIARQLESNTGGPVQLLRIRMPDSDGRLLTVQVFHSPFLEMDDRVGHLLGLIEGSLDESTLNSPVNSVIPERVPPPAALESASAAVGRIVSNRSSLSDSACSSDNTESLASTLGSAISGLVQDWMQMMPIQDEVCVAIGIDSEAEATSTAAEQGQVLHMSAGIQIFCPPATLRCGIQYAAACSLEYHLTTPESFIFKLTLSEMKPHKIRRPLQTGRQQDHRYRRSTSPLAILSERGVVKCRSL
ncbi:unnamed protein product [Polarella glacialis]|uniref:PAS domain-containing protein n=1 Tax=Polarella glacialis TaxID=89957 RepID=A0A813I7T2_POLGL|nr:unnamed protein product [Polarella glacialis]